MKRNIKNSSGKIIGYTEIYDDKIIIHNNLKPELILEDLDLIKEIKNKNKDSKVLLKLYDDYLLSAGEIASLYDVCYSNINFIINTLETKTSKKTGRRNSSYGKQRSESTKEKISEK